MRRKTSKSVLYVRGTFSSSIESRSIIDEIRSAVSTPLWADPALKEQFPIQEKAMPAECVADVLMRLVQEGKYRGGSIITLSSKDEIKVLPEHESWAALERIAGTAYAPVRETLKAERKIA